MYLQWYNLGIGALGSDSLTMRRQSMTSQTSTAIGIRVSTAMAQL
jgi:hypothetical protein